MNYKAVIQYEGTRYRGWQVQGNTGNTIQGKLEALLTRMEGAPVEVRGSGRTDAGVHAAGQVISFRCACGKSPQEIRDYMNQYLPEDIAVLSVEEMTREKIEETLKRADEMMYFVKKTTKHRYAFYGQEA